MNAPEPHLQFSIERTVFPAPDGEERFEKSPARSIAGRSITERSITAQRGERGLRHETETKLSTRLVSLYLALFTSLD